MIRRSIAILACLAAASPARAASTLDFLASIGVNTHLDDSKSSYGRVGTVIDQLRFIGVSRLRDTVVAVPDLAPFRQAAAAGMRFDLIVMDEPARAIPTLRAMAKALTGIEGPNEVNVTAVHFHGETGPAAAVAVQKELYAAVRRDPLLHAIPVLAFSVAQGGSFAPYGNLAAFASAVSVHAYAEFGVPPYWMLQPVIAGVTLAPGRPPIVTEIGNYTMPDRKSGVPELVQAKWVLDTLLDNFSHGIAATYVYELEDEHPDPGNTDSEAHYGLFSNDGTAKPAARALHALSAILRTGVVAEPGAGIAASFAGLPDYGFHVTLAKAPGLSDIVLWAEPAIWNHETGVETPGMPQRVTVTLPAAARAIRVYDPLRGTEPIATIADAAGVEVALTDHPMVVEVAQ